MPIVTLTNGKNELALPEIGYVRKGAPKSSDGHIGKDLNSKFRVGFFVGNEEKQELFTKHYGSLYPTRLNVLLPFSTINENWDCWYEAYSQSRMIARADGEKFIRLIDMKTGQVIVNNGVPYTAFDPNIPVGYYKSVKKGETPLMAQQVGRLRFVIRELQLLNIFTLHTTSVYDIANITMQLNALVQIAGMAGRSISGVPLEIFRSPKSITWVKDDGTSARVEKWLINLEASKRWVDSMMLNMQEIAVTPALMESAQRLPATIGNDPITITSKDIQAVKNFESDDEELNIEDGITKSEMKIEEIERPYPPETLQSNYKTMVAELLKVKDEGRLKIPVNLKNRSEMIVPAIESALIGERSETVHEWCRKIMMYLTGANDMRIMDDINSMALLKWLAPEKDSGGAITCCDFACIEIQELYNYMNDNDTARMG